MKVEKQHSKQFVTLCLHMFLLLTLMAINLYCVLFLFVLLFLLRFAIIGVGLRNGTEATQPQLFWNTPQQDCIKTHEKTLKLSMIAKALKADI